MQLLNNQTNQIKKFIRIKISLGESDQPKHETKPIRKQENPTTYIHWISDENQTKQMNANTNSVKQFPTDTQEYYTVLTTRTEFILGTRKCAPSQERVIISFKLQEAI